MDKLARLMPGLPQYVCPQRLAESGERIAGQLELRDMRRLRELLYDESGTVTFHLDFEMSEQGFVRIAGGYSTCLRVVCQRCLEPLEFGLERPIEVAAVPAAEVSGRLPASVEPLTLEEDDRLHLAGFIEDEILLGLPIAPMHEEGQCRVLARPEEGDPDASHPFAVLRNLKIGND